jgi:uncharacterized RDD family membrane protein YckC
MLKPNPICSQSGELRAVIYSDSDYAGFWRRMLVCLVDGSVFLFSMSIVSVVGKFLPLPGPVRALMLLSAIIVLPLAYFVSLKGAGRRTLGYWIAGVQLVDVYGGHVSYWTLMKRSAWGIFTFIVIPPFFLGDAYFMFLDKHRQTLRDRLAHTYVVRTDAKPKGFAKVVRQPCQMLCLSFVFEGLRELKVKPDSESKSNFSNSSVIQTQPMTIAANPLERIPVPAIDEVPISPLLPAMEPAPLPPHRVVAQEIPVPPPLPGARAKAFDPSVMDCLERLGSLRDRGVLTEQEFDLEKQKLLRPGDRR